MESYNESAGAYPQKNPISPVRPNRSGLALTSMIIGCVSSFFYLIMLLVIVGEGNTAAVGLLAMIDILLSILSLIFGLIAIRSSKWAGMAIAGVSMGGFIFLTLILFLVVGLSME